MIQLPGPAQQPTMYFIGVTTGQSSVMSLFPGWANILGLKNACIRGIDLPIHASADEYRRCVEFISQDPLSMGALVTTHKIDLYNAAADLFDELDPYAKKFGELSSISKQQGRLMGHAKDPITAGLALDHFIGSDYWLNSGGEAAVLGAGGSALAISAYLALDRHGNNRPRRIHLTNRSPGRLAAAVEILADSQVQLSLHLCPRPGQNDLVIEQLPAGSLIVNATGLGKDRPGSPLTDQVRWPDQAIVWELNYRGSLEFMQQALGSRLEKKLTIEDGWIYFIYGWTEVIAEVFHIKMNEHLFSACHDLAMRMRS